MEGRPHAVAIPIPLQGHVSPLMHLCKALASSGFVITVINTEPVQSRMKDVLDALNDGLEIRFETVPGAPVDLDLFYGDNRLLFLRAMEAMEQHCEKLLLEKISETGPPVSCLISDFFCKWPRNLARRLGLQHVTFSTATAQSILVDYYVPKLLENGDIPVQDFSIDKTINYLPGVSPLPLWAIPFIFSARDSVFDVGFVRRHSRTVQLAEDSWIIFNSLEEFEGDALEVVKELNPNTIAVGPLLLHPANELAANPSLWDEDAGCLPWLDKQMPESVIYISFGSLATLSLEQFEEISAGLIELQKPFIWAIRPKSVTDLDPDAFEGFKTRASSYGLVVSWAPQLEVLRHSSTGGALSHCGWNSTLESICGGVPMICWPCVAEQNLNCKMVVEDMKIGLKLSDVGTLGKIVSRDEFVKAVNTLMGGDDGKLLRNNARKLKEEAIKSISEGGTSNRNLGKFVEAMKSSCSKV